MCLVSISARSGFVSDLLPDVDGARSVGSDARAWLNGAFKSQDDVNNYLSRIHILTKAKPDDPYYPNSAYSQILLEQENPVGMMLSKLKFWLSPTVPVFSLDFWSEAAQQWKIALQYSEAIDEITLGGNLLPSGTFDLGYGTQRWRDHAHSGWLMLGDVGSRGISLPSPSSAYRLFGIGSLGGAGAEDNYQICRKRAAGDYKWKDIFDSFQVVPILKDVDGITKTDIGTTAVEILTASHRTKVDLTYFDRCRAVFGGFNSEAATFFCRIQYSTNQTNWYDLTPEASVSATSDVLVSGAWGNIPAGALGDVFVRAVGRAGNSTADPTYKNIELQVR